MSAVGYCLFPLSVLGFIISLLPVTVPAFVKLILIIIALLWSTVSCLLVMRDLVEDEKKWLCGYPIFLFYVFMAWYSIVAWLIKYAVNSKIICIFYAIFLSPLLIPLRRKFLTLAYHFCRTGNLEAYASLPLTEEHSRSQRNKGKTLSRWKLSS